MSTSPSPVRLFAYGSLREGESDHECLAGAESLGIALTCPSYYLVELNAFPALVPGGSLAVTGELYVVDRTVLARLDAKKQHPILFRREPVTLADGTQAEAYQMTLDQVRGRRRLKSGDWKQRFTARPTGMPESAWARWARSRWTKG